MEPLQSEQILEQAIAAAGFDDFGESAFREGLDRLVDSWNTESHLNEIGRMMAEGTTVQHLINRLGIVQYAKDHPEITGRAIDPPIVIVGQGRTGTTILFDLLAQDPAVRVPRTWEVDLPLPPPLTATYETDERIATVDTNNAGTEFLIPGFSAIHPMGAQLAQECVQITASDFRSVMYPTVYRVPTYAKWVMYEADMAPAYRWHRRFLEHLQAEHSGDRWLLKSPAHIWCLDALVGEYPNAMLVQTHRDPLRVIASLASLQEVLRRLGMDEPDLIDIAHEWAEYVIEGLDRSVAARVDGTVRDERVVDVNFDAFMADPFGAIREVYEALGYDFTKAIEQRMRNFLATNPQDKHGRHAYTWEATGLDRSYWRERARPYQEYFDVPNETFT